MDSLLWKMNYKDIRWVQTSSSVSSDMAEVSVKLNLLETRCFNRDLLQALDKYYYYQYFNYAIVNYRYRD